MLLQATGSRLLDLLERVPPLLKADQHGLIDPALVAAIEEVVVDGDEVEELDARARVALGNYYYSKGQPVQALQCWWRSMRDGDDVTRIAATNNAAVANFGFCPGRVARPLFDEASRSVKEMA